jgi:hypothetical protein
MQRREEMAEKWGQKNERKGITERLGEQLFVIVLLSDRSVDQA